MALAEEIGRTLWFVVLDEDTAWLEELHERFIGRADLRMAGGTSDARDVRRLVAENGADLVLVAGRLAGTPALAAVGALARQMPGVRVYLMAERPTRELWDAARQRGARGVLRKPFTAEDLALRLQEDMEVEARQTRGLDDAAPPGPLAGAPVTADAPRAIAVFSFKGGVGKSLVAANLAVAAAATVRPQRRQVALVDADDGVGTTPTLLGVTGHPTLLDWAEYEGERTVDPAIAARKLAELKCGLRCVFAPGEMDRTVSGPLMDTVLVTLRGMFGLVVVDCAPQVTEAVLCALQQCTTLLLVVEPTLDCLDKVRRGLAALQAAGVGAAKVRVLVNQGRPGAGEYTAAEVREALGLPVLGRLPFDAEVRRCVNRRQPLALGAEHGPFMTALLRSVECILPGLGPRRSRWPWAPWR